MSSPSGQARGQSAEQRAGQGTRLGQWGCLAGRMGVDEAELGGGGRAQRGDAVAGVADGAWGVAGAEPAAVGDMGVEGAGGGLAASRTAGVVPGVRVVRGGSQSAGATESGRGVAGPATFGVGMGAGSGLWTAGGGRECTAAVLV